jgi:hypothetical protein
MRPSRGSSICLPLLGTILFLFAIPRISAQNASQWSATANALAEKIAAAAGTPGSIAMSMANISSLSSTDASSAYDLIFAALRARKFQITAGSTAPTSGVRVQVTFSEDASHYIWVAQLWTAPGADARVVMVTAPRPAKSAARAADVVLDAKLIWEQPGPILDFAMPINTDSTQTVLALLEPRRLAFYSRTLTDWQLVRALDAPPGRGSRDWRGHIDLSHGAATGEARSFNNECSGDFTRPSTILCTGNGSNADSWISGAAQPPVKPIAGGDAVSLGSLCDGHSLIVVTGGGDWTQPDTIQAQEIIAAAFVNSGNPISTDGPITAIWSGSAPGTARAVVRNLQTGNYEAYLVTSTCSQ